MKFFIFVLMFLVVSALLIISNNHLVMNTSENFFKFSERYVAWLEGVFFNTQIITGEAVKLDWFPSSRVK